MTGNQRSGKIVVTGASGQLGFIAALRLERHFGYQVDRINRNSFAEPGRLAEAVADADAVLHLAGVNRGLDESVSTENPLLAELLVGALEESRSRAHVLYGSTIQIERDNVYGRAKKRAGEILQGGCARAGLRYTELVLPNLYGEFSRPNYNNFTGTFCQQLVQGRPLTVNDPAAPVELMHYADVADTVHGCVRDESTGVVRPQGTRTTVGEVAQMLAAFHETYAKGVFPDVREPFALKLFNMLRGYMFETQFPFKLVRHADARGSFFECIRAINSGQTAFSTTVPGITRGDHFHFNKVERFLVLSGKARIKVRRLIDHRTWEFDVSGDEPVFVDMPTLHTHNITNTGTDQLLTLFWTHDFFDPEHPDTYVEAV